MRDFRTGVASRADSQQHPVYCQWSCENSSVYLYVLYVPLSTVRQWDIAVNFAMPKRETPSDTPTLLRFSTAGGSFSCCGAIPPGVSVDFSVTKKGEAYYPTLLRFPASLGAFTCAAAVKHMVCFNVLFTRF